MQVCEGCNQKFEIDSLLKHIAGKKSCKEKYGDEKFEKMKKEKRKMGNKKWREKTQREICMKIRKMKRYLSPLLTTVTH